MIFRAMVQYIYVFAADFALPLTRRIYVYATRRCLPLIHALML